VTAGTACAARHRTSGAEAGEAFGAHPRRYRRRAALSQRDRAERVGLSVDTVSTLKRGRHTLPHPETAARLAKAERAALVEAAHSALPTACAEAASNLWSPTVPSTNLPAPLSSFIGREQEQAEVAELVGRCRLVTLTGAGGVGKTRLALRVAEELYAGYPGGAWLVELSSLADPLLVPDAVAAVCGLREEHGHPLLTTLPAYLHGKELLLVLDNREHLVDGCARLAAAILRQCPRVRLPATSREALSVTGECRDRVSSLTVPDPLHLPAYDLIPAYEVVRLFAIRAQACK
jgi:transcriptional regulator with XRE-family HTH domain